MLQAQLPTIIWMTTPVQHFATAQGGYDPKELGKQCQPLTAWYEVSAVAADIFEGLRLALDLPACLPAYRRITGPPVAAWCQPLTY
jgi:hypothetical protein